MTEEQMEELSDREPDEQMEELSDREHEEREEHVGNYIQFNNSAIDNDDCDIDDDNIPENEVEADERAVTINEHQTQYRTDSTAF